jgi:pyruvate/2-oxoglutarate dehydrogenase complex dihydrolipoamide dehydrogenase (E3) component
VSAVFAFLPVARRKALPQAEGNPIGSFIDPEYAQVGLTEAQARKAHDVVMGVVRFDEATRTIIDGRPTGFCKLIADRVTATILGCHVVGERAVEIVQVVAIAIAAGLRVEDVAQVRSRFRRMPASSDARHTAPPALSKNLSDAVHLRSAD